MSRRNTIVALLALCLIVIGGLLYADGAFSSSWTVRLDSAAHSRHISELGPPTRLTTDVDPSGVERPKVLAEPVYADVRIPSFFDEVDVQLRLWEAQNNENDIKVGFELGRDSGEYAFGTTTVEAIPALGQAPLPTTVHTRLSLAGIPHEDNRFRFVLSLPGVDPDHPVRIDSLTITARHSGNWKHMLSRFFHF